METGSSLVLGNLIFDGGASKWYFSEEEAASYTNSALRENGDTQITGGFIQSNGASLIIGNCIFQNNLSKSSSAITVSGTAENKIDVKMLKTKIDHCARISGGAGALSCSNANVEIKMNSSITNNYGYGNSAIIGLSYNSNLILNGGKISDNNYYANGLIMPAVNSVFTMNDGEISYNTGYAISGGNWAATVYCHNDGTFVMNGGRIEKNTTQQACVMSFRPTSVIVLNKGYVGNNISRASNFADLLTANGVATIGKDAVVEGECAYYALLTNNGTINGSVRCYATGVGEFINNGIIKGILYTSDGSQVVNNGIVTGGIINLSEITE